MDFTALSKLAGTIPDAKPNALAKNPLRFILHLRKKLDHLLNSAKKSASCVADRNASPT